MATVPFSTSVSGTQSEKGLQTATIVYLVVGSSGDLLLLNYFC